MHIVVKLLSDVYFLPWGDITAFLCLATLDKNLSLLPRAILNSQVSIKTHKKNCEKRGPKYTMKKIVVYNIRTETRSQKIALFQLSSTSEQLKGER